LIINIKIFLPFLLLLPSILFSSEVDSFHNRYAKISDSKITINLFANKLFDKTLERANRKDGNCNKDELYKSVRREFHNSMFGDFNKYISNSHDLERIRTLTPNSIYGKLSFKDSLVLGFVSKRISESMATLINFNGHLVGDDKFQHFAGTGYNYFKNYYLKNNSIESTLDIGNGDENGILGSVTTGVISYGDMTAEFNGMRFWNDILANYPDILNVENGPYVKCSMNRWIKIKAIDFSVYVDDGWDEGINCSRFRTTKILEKVKASVKKLELKTDINYTCPIIKESSTALNVKYGFFSKYLINTEWDIKIK
jgi:hypothetical protein